MNISKRTYGSLLAASYLLTCGLVYYKQRSLMYFPNKGLEYDNNLWKKVSANDHFLGFEYIHTRSFSDKEEFSKLTTNEQIKVLNKNDNVVINDDVDCSLKMDNLETKTIVVFHGNSGNASSREYYQTFFNKMICRKNQYRIIVAEYPGFGLNSEQAITKENFINHARAIMKYVKANYGGKIIVTGESLGTGIASQMASEFEVEKLLLITPYSSIGEVAQSRFWFLPVGLLLKDNYNSKKNLKNYQGDTLILVAQNDLVVPPKFADRLYKSIQNKKQKIIIENASHSNWMRFLTKSQKNEISSFL